MKKVNLIVTLTLPLFVLLGCVSSPVVEEINALYKTDHFDIYYRENDFSIQEIEIIAEKKERILDHINHDLEVNYSGKITAYLYLYGVEYAFANLNEEIHESRPYVMNDDGHEIAHIVTFQELGYSRNRFLKEGIAVAHEMKISNVNVIEEFVEYHNNPYVNYIDTVSIEKQILNSSWDGSYHSYARAGAFLKYLKITIGLDEVKEFYNRSIYNKSSVLGWYFKDIFSKDLAVMEKEFFEIYFPDTSVQVNSR